MFTSITLSRSLSLLLIAFLIPTSPSSTDIHFSLPRSLPPSLPSPPVAEVTGLPSLPFPSPPLLSLPLPSSS